MDYLYLFLPALATYLTFYLQWGYPASYGLGKIALALLPVFIFWFSRRAQPNIIKPCLKHYGAQWSFHWLGLVSGLVIGGTILLAYYGGLKEQLPSIALRKKLHEMGLTSMLTFWSMAIFLSAVNSLQEEWYWRGFITDRLRTLGLRRWPAILLSGTCFGLHHIFPMLLYFPAGYAWLFVGGTVLGGIWWSWLREHNHSLLTTCISHACVDLAIMWIGWDILNQ